MLVPDYVAGIQLGWVYCIQFFFSRQEYMVIPLDKVEIIKHCCKKLLYYEDSVWIKKGEGGNFDVSIGAYDGAEICELVGYVLLYSINKIMDPNNHGLLRDNGLIIVDKSTPKKCDGIRKKKIV